MSLTQAEKIIKLCTKIRKETRQRLTKDELDCKVNLDNTIATFKVGNKYTKIDVGNSGKYMIDNSNQQIFGIKAYGVIHKGHQYGTLDTIDAYNWGNYTAVKIKKEP